MIAHYLSVDLIWQGSGKVTKALKWHAGLGSGERGQVASHGKRDAAFGLKMKTFGQMLLQRSDIGYIKSFYSFPFWKWGNGRIMQDKLSVDEMETYFNIIGVPCFLFLHLFIRWPLQLSENHFWCNPSRREVCCWSSSRLTNVSVP